MSHVKPLQLFADTDIPIQTTEDFFAAIALGRVKGFSCINKFGHNHDVGASIETVWSPGGLYVYPNDTVLTVSSDDANDTSAGTGARTIELTGQTAEHEEFIEIVTLDGQTPVATTNTFYRIYRAEILTAGNSDENVGNIYIGTGTVTGGVPAVINAQIDIAQNQTMMTVYSVPKGKTVFIRGLNVGVGGTKDVSVYLYVRDHKGNGTTFKTKVHYHIFQTPYFRKFQFGLRIPEKSDIEVRANIFSGSAGPVAVDLDLMLIDSELEGAIE